MEKSVGHIASTDYSGEIQKSHQHRDRREMILKLDFFFSFLYYTYIFRFFYDNKIRCLIVSNSFNFNRVIIWTQDRKDRLRVGVGGSNPAHPLDIFFFFLYSCRVHNKF